MAKPPGARSAPGGLLPGYWAELLLWLLVPVVVGAGAVVTVGLLVAGAGGVVDELLPVVGVVEEKVCGTAGFGGVLVLSGGL